MAGVPYTFGSATTSIPLSQLDSNFTTPVTIGTTTVALGNTTTTLAGLTSVATNTLTSAAATALTLQSAGTTALTIDTSQNVGIGQTTVSYKLDVLATVSNYSTRIVNNNAGPAGLYINYSAASPNNTGAEFLICTDATTNRFIARSNGGLANYSANNVNLSDRREKTNFAPAGNYLAKICAIPVQTFNYIDQNIKEDDGLTLGVVAQDVQAVAPELVSESDWSSEKDGSKVRLSIYQTDLQYALMKCIQEQQTLITALTARITALETK